jgi:tetratricopeptide (TPR) repeat protein
MASAIELYRRAYDLDYRKGDWQQAEELYKEIVEKFPYSDEKEYALVHLDRIQKLRANPQDQKLAPVRAAGSAVNGFNIVNFFLILILAVGVALAGYLIWQQNRTAQYQSLVIRGMSSEHSGNHSLAAALYKEAQEMMPGRPLAYQFLAELYMNTGQYGLAEIESKRWAIAGPGDTGLADFRIRLQNAMEAETKERQ